MCDLLFFYRACIEEEHTYENEPIKSLTVTLTNENINENKPIAGKEKVNEPNGENIGTKSQPILNSSFTSSPSRADLVELNNYRNIRRARTRPNFLPLRQKNIATIANEFQNGVYDTVRPLNPALLDVYGTGPFPRKHTRYSLLLEQEVLKNVRIARRLGKF